MLKGIISDIKLAVVNSLLKILKTGDLKNKIKAFKKLDKMKITKEIGLILLEESTYDFGIKDGNGGISASLVSLCIKDYKKEYSEVIKKNFKKYNKECKDKVLLLLSSIDNEYALDLYGDLILKYYKEENHIPVGNLYERPQNYKYLFPKLYKALKFKDDTNNLLLLINDYLNAGVVPEVDIKKNKKLIQDNISRVFNLGLKFNFTNTSKSLQNDRYLNLRLFLELAVNIEYYVSTRKTEELLSKLYNKNDNQLKLFIIENYIRKGKKLNRLSFDEIAKDNASRYPLFDLMTIYNMSDLLPKKNMTPEKIALSDLYVNFTIINGYKELPKNIKFIEAREINNFLYYIFTFNYTYENNNNYDDTTNYIISNVGLDKYNGKKITAKFVGVSGGYSKTVVPSLVQTVNNRLLWDQIKDNEKIDDVVERIVPNLNKKIEEKEEITTDKNYKNLRQIIEEEEEKKEKEKNKFIFKFKKAVLPKKDKIKKVKKEKVVDLVDTTFEEETSKWRFSFSYVLLFLFIVFVGVSVLFNVYLEHPEYINKGDYPVTVKTVKATSIESADRFREINGHDIFNQPEEDYYVLFFKNKTRKNSYFTYINILLKNDVTVCYVDLDKEENFFLYDANDLGFVVTTDRYMKVETGEFNFYVDGKKNILEEIKSEANVFIKQEEERKKEKERQKREEAKQESKENKKE